MKTNWMAGLLLAAFFTAGAAQAQTPEALVRKNLSERLPQMGRIDEVTRSPMPGLYEVRVGTDLYYTDPEGNFVIEGNIVDTKTRRDLTEERQQKLLAIDFEALPLKDAFKVVRGDGKRRFAVFEDPNCGYCKTMERDLQKVDNVTMYVFLYPILGRDSEDKSRDIWCAKDPQQAWLDWMLKNQRPPSATCDTSAIARNVQMGRRHKVSGTPTVILPNGQRVAGAVPAAQLEKLLAAK